MHRTILSSLFLLFLFTVPSLTKNTFGSYVVNLALGHGPKAQSQAAGGADCVGCVLVISIVEQMTYVHEKPVAEVLDMLCKYLPSLLTVWCEDLINQYGLTIINMLENGETPDLVCLQIDFCVDRSCHLFPPPSSPTPFMKAYPSKDAYPIPQPSRLGTDPLQWLWDLLSQLVNSHLPIIDIDGDKFSSSDSFRGARWRGKDCNDFAKDVYPGRSQSNYNADVDHNCNGIFGVNPTTLKSYESELCDGIPSYGVGVLGDSASAHFHIPPSYMMAQLINETTYENIVDILLDEFDWPHMSSSTGFEESDWQGRPPGPVNSFYLLMRERNRCVHRDYQNIAVNGARSGSMADDIVYTFSRNKTTDRPIWLTYALIGNDVCNGHPDFDHFTTPEQMFDNVMKTLNYLDNGILPANSHVFIMGLADGTKLYDFLHNRIHPLGALRKDITYAQFYDFMNCVQASPCWGWMNTNETVRNITQQHANGLNLVLQNITSNQKFSNFDLHYFASPINAVINMWVANGGHVWDLIEPVDGFHPSQIGNELVASYLWNYVMKTMPEIVPPVNPNNARIQQLFGNQSGY